MMRCGTVLDRRVRVFVILSPSSPLQQSLPTAPPRSVAVTPAELLMLLVFAALFLPLCAATNRMASVDLWPSAKLHVSTPTWWLEVSRHHKYFSSQSQKKHRPSPSRRVVPSVTRFAEPLSFQLRRLERRPGELRGGVLLRPNPKPAPPRRPPLLAGLARCER